MLGDVRSCAIRACPASKHQTVGTEDAVSDIGQEGQPASPSTLEFKSVQGGLKLKSSFLQTAVCAIAVITLVSNATAQTSRGTAVAVLDVSRVFKEHTTFTKKMDSLKAEAKEFERSINQQQQEIVKRAKEVSEEYSSSSLEFKRAEAELAQRQSDLRVKLQLKRKEMLEREAKLYYETYQRMLQIVNGLADKHQLSLVL